MLFPKMSSWIDIGPSVQAALESKGAVVALESSIIANGLPFPHNIETAFSCEAAVREHGAVPATIGVIDGRVVVGLSGSQIEMLGSPRKEVFKAASQDLPAVLASKGNAATTVSATMALSQLVGVDVFATGGIGGVHRDFEHTCDMSTDLTQLARCSMTVVCSGAKSILDLPKTLEMLETLGVLVCGFQTHDLPAFYSRSCGLKVHHKFDAASDVADCMQIQRALAQRSALLLLNPPPLEHALEFDVIESAIHEALREARIKEIKGKAVTPFLLSRLEGLTLGRTLAANKALVKSNAKLAAEVAIAWARVRVQARVQARA